MGEGFLDYFTVAPADLIESCPFDGTVSGVAEKLIGIALFVVRPFGMYRQPPLGPILARDPS